MYIFVDHYITTTVMVNSISVCYDDGRYCSTINNLYAINYTRYIK